MSSWREFRVKPRIPATLIGLFISLTGVLLLAHAFYSLYYMLGGPSISWSALIYTLAQLIGFLILLYVLRMEGQPFSTIWFGRGDLRDYAYALAFLILAWIVWGAMDFLGRVLGIPEVRWWERWPINSPLDVLPIGVFALAASFFEEIFYRGYAITRLYSLTGNIILASIISIAFFTLLHHVFGPRVMLCILGWGTIATILFILRRSTKASFYLHLTNNAIVYVLFPLIWPWR